MKIHAGRSSLWKKDASFYAGKGLAGGRGTVSLRSYNYRHYFLAHNSRPNRYGHTAVFIRRYNRSAAYKKSATWTPVATRC
jgi:hypothetical protein